MTVLVTDTETTGFINSRELATHASQPHLVQLAALLYTDDGVELTKAALIVRVPDGVKIPEQAANVHGITTEKSLAFGVPLRVAIALYTNLRAMADVVVAHNWDFDRVVLDAAIHRSGGVPKHPGPMRFCCTMQSLAPIMQLPPTDKMRAAGFTKHKPPNLGEAVQYCFKEKLEGAHDALVDATACARVYFWLKQREKAAA